MSDAATPRDAAAIRLIVFDLDGTLVDAFADLAAAVNHMLALDGLPPRSVEEVKRHVGRGIRMLVAGILGTSDEALLDEKTRIFADFYARNAVRETHLYDGVAQALARLDVPGRFLAVASNKPDALTRTILEQLGVAKHFDWIIGQSDAFPRKPDPAILRHLMAQAGAAPPETLVVGDTPIDIEFARAAGARVAAVTWGQCTRDDLVPLHPDAIVDSIAQLVDGLEAGTLFAQA